MSKISVGGPFVEIGPGFWNLRSSFTMACGLIDIGTHMSLLKLNSGKYLVIDTCDVSGTAKAQIDQITNNGELIEGVVATHPFHTIYFPAFYRLYPNVKYYGTPRHLRNQPSIPWAGDVNNIAVRNQWESEGVFMKIPHGAEFAQPAESNHFSAVMVFHKESRTVHDDDTIMFFSGAGGCILRCAKSPGTMEFWDLKAGLLPEKDAPLRFKAWVEEVLREWDFDNLCAAHTGNKIGGAKQQLQAVLTAAVPQLEKISRGRK